MVLLLLQLLLLLLLLQLLLGWSLRLELRINQVQIILGLLFWQRWWLDIIDIVVLQCVCCSDLSDLPVRYRDSSSRLSLVVHHERTLEYWWVGEWEMRHIDAVWCKKRRQRFVKDVVIDTVAAAVVVVIICAVIVAPIVLWYINFIIVIFIFQFVLQLL